jgi:hypothetical protein
MTMPAQEIIVLLMAIYQMENYGAAVLTVIVLEIMPPFHLTQIKDAE